jgi:hypothetical protein
MNTGITGAGNFVSWKDYQGLQGFGSMDQQQMQDLRKALTAGSSINAPAFVPGEGFALRMESLEKTLKVTTYKMDDLQLWPSVTKLPAWNTIEEFMRLDSYGSGNAAYIAEGEAPSSDDSIYSRQYVQIKMMGTLRAVTHVMTLMRTPIGNVISQETINGTAWLLRQVERGLFNGDHTKIPVQFDGLNYQITTGAPNPTLNVIDMRGLPLTEDALNDGGLIIKAEPNYGKGTDLHLPDGAYADLAKQFYPNVRIPLAPGGFSNGMVGVNIQGFYSQFGPVRFHPNTFLQFGPTCPVSGVGNPAQRPSPPAENAVPAGAGGPTSKFLASDAGNYIWRVCAINRYGRSAPLVMTGPLMVNAGDVVTMTVGDGATPGTAFEVYRTDAGGATLTARLQMTVARTGAATLITDTNDNLPGTCQCYFIQQNLEFFSFKQLAPFMKIPFATVDLSIRWAQALYGALAVYTPGRGVIYRNVGRAPGSVGLNNGVI